MKVARYMSTAVPTVHYSITARYVLVSAALGAVGADVARQACASVTWGAVPMLLSNNRILVSSPARVLAVAELVLLPRATLGLGQGRKGAHVG